MRREAGDPRPNRTERARSYSELPADPKYWTRLADRIEAESHPVLRAALGRSQGGVSEDPSSVAWISGAGKVGRWVIPVAAAACALMMTWMPTGDRDGRGAGSHVEATVQGVIEDVAEQENASAWRTAMSPSDPIGRLFASSRPPSLLEVLPWAADALHSARSTSAEEGRAEVPQEARPRDEVDP